MNNYHSGDKQEKKKPVALESGSFKHMIKLWYQLFVNFCSAILFNSTSFQEPVFKMSAFTLNIVALFILSHHRLDAACKK